MFKCPQKHIAKSHKYRVGTTRKYLNDIMEGTRDILRYALWVHIHTI